LTGIYALVIVQILDKVKPCRIHYLNVLVQTPKSAVLPPTNLNLFTSSGVSEPALGH